MRILYLHQYYRTPLEGGGIRSYHVARALTQAGHEVHIVTTWDGPCRRVDREGRLLVTYLPIRYGNEMNRAERIRAFFRFVWGSYRVARAWLPAERVFATSTPLTIGITALLLKALRGVSYVFEVRDAWPEGPIQLGYVPNPLYRLLLRGLERRIYANARALIALSPPIAEHVRLLAPDRPVHLIPNFADAGFFYPAEPIVPAPWPGGPYHIVYAGTFGYANQTARLLALILSAHQAGLHVNFTLAGEGAERTSVEAFVRKHSLPGVTLLAHQSTYGVRQLLTVADAAYVGFRPEPVLAGNSPNKFFDALAAGLPVLLGTGGWLAAQVREAKCGVVLGDHSSDLAGLRALLDADQAALRIGAAGLASRFDRARLAGEVAAVVVRTPSRAL